MESSASLTSTKHAELAAVQPSCTTTQLDRTTSGQDLLPTSQVLVAHDSGGAAEIQDSEPLDCIDGEVSFDAFWRTYMSGAENGLEFEDDDMMRSENSPPGGPKEPSPQPNPFLDTASLHQLTDSSHETAIAHEDSSGGAVHVGMNSVSWLCRYSTYQLIIRLEYFGCSLPFH